MKNESLTARARARRVRLSAFLSSLFLLLPSTLLSQVNILTRGYDGARTGANLEESVLTPANVGSSNFGKLFTVHTDGQVYAQPLYVSNLGIGGGTHNVVFVASMLNTVYALDADTGAVLWQQNYGAPIVPQDVETDQNIVWSTRIGILSTPVIDAVSNTMYFVSGYQPSAQQFQYRLNAVDITSGSPVHGSPVTISATYSTPDLASPLVFNAKILAQRPSLTLGNGNVYIAFGSHEDQNSYHGWVLAYDISTLAQTAVYVDTTIGFQGGIWNAGQAPAIDGAGNLYLTTGNGSFGKTPNNLVQTGNSILKLSPTLELLDYFTPYNSANLNSGDMDLGSAGLLLVPGTNYLLGGGKQGVLYLADTNGLGGFNSSADKVRQEFQAVYGKGTSHIHGTPVYFNSDVNGPSTYVWGENDVLRGFHFNGTTGLVNTTPFATSSMTAPVTNNDGAMPGGFMSISASGGSNGIVWASTPYNGDAVHKSVQGVLYAFDANTLALLWSDKNNDARDEIGMFAKYAPPIVANGKMYVSNFGAIGTNDGSGSLVAYGLLKSKLTVQVANASMTAGAALPTFTGNVTGLVHGDQVGSTIIVSYSTTATSSSAPGSYPITATVSGSSAPNYTVTVTDGTLTINSASQTLTVSANNATRAYGAANPVFSGTVTGAQNGDTFTESFSTAATPGSTVGNYTIVPTASGSNLANYTVNTVNGTLTVTPASTTTTLTAPATTTYGANITMSAAVTSAAGAPTGSVTFYSGTTNLGSAALNGSGVATLATAALPGGSDAVTAAYAAAGNYSASTSGASSVIVSAGAQTITFAAAGPRTYGSAPFGVSANSSAGSSYPVTITVLSGPAVISGGVVTARGAGTVVLQAAQAGDANYASASTTQTFQVAPAPLTVTGSDASRAYNAPNPAFSGTVAGAVGSDRFTQSFSTTATVTSNIGSYPIVPAVSGAQLSNYTVTYINGKLTVAAAATTTTLIAPGQAVYGGTVTLTATVTSASGTPSGVVTFLFENASAVLGTVALNTSGVAVLTTSTLPAGADDFTAVYAANGNFAGSSSSASTVTVSAASGGITFAAIGSRVYGSAPFAVTASASPGNTSAVNISVQSGPAILSGGMLTLTGVGTVVLQAAQAGNAQYAAAIATQSFQVLPAVLQVTANSAARAYGAANPAFSGNVTGAVGSDSFSASFTTPATASSNAGAYPIVPAVTGAALANYTVNGVNGTLTVTAAATSTAFSAPASAVYGASVALTATVRSSAGTPAGSVSFATGSTILGASPVNAGAVAILNTAALPVGSNAITATYVAMGNFAGSVSPAVTLVVSAAPISAPGNYRVDASPSLLTLAGKATAATTLTLTPTGGYSGMVALSCANLPANASCQFALNQITLSGDNKPVTVGLTLSATKPQAKMQRLQMSEPGLWLALALWWPGSLSGLAWVVGVRRLLRAPRVWLVGLLVAGSCILLTGLSGCGASGLFTATTTTSQVTVVATGTSGGAVTTQNIILTVKMTE